MWAGRLGWPPHPCSCRLALQRLQPKIAFRFRPHVTAVQTDHRSRSCSLICTPVRSRSMTRLGCRTQARRVFRQGNGINPHFQHTPQYFSPICRCSGMCKTSLLDVDTVRGTDELGWESRRQLSPGRCFLAQPGHRNLPVPRRPPQISIPTRR